MKHNSYAVDETDELSDRRAKRHKSSKACQTCRQQKSRCEPAMQSPGSVPSTKCHRCARLNLQCSFERSPPPDPQPAKNGQAEPQQQSGGSISPRPPPHRHRGLDSDIPGNTGRRTGQHSTTQSFASSPTTQTSLPAHPIPPITPVSPPQSSITLGEPSSALEHATTMKNSWAPNKANGPSKQWGAPLTFLRELMESVTNKHSEGSQRPNRVKEDNLIAREIVDHAEAAVLTRIWTSHYAPWLPIEQSFSQPETPSRSLTDPPNHHRENGRDDFPTSGFLQAAQWTLAIRHLPATFGARDHLASLRSQLGVILAQCLSKAMIGLDDSLPTLRALLILATWPTHFIRPLTSSWTTDISYTDEQVGPAYDSELLSATAMHIASRMHLELDVENALAQKRGGHMANTFELVGHSEVLDRARVMFAVSVNNTQLNLGKNRISSPRVPFEHAEQIFGSAEVLATRSGGSGDACLVFQCNALTKTLQAMENSTVNEAARPSDFNAWTQNITDAFNSFDQLQRALSTAFALTPHDEIIPITSVMLQAHFLYLNVILRAFRALFEAFPAIPVLSSPKSSPRARHPELLLKPIDLIGPSTFETQIKPLVHDWGKRSHNAAERALTTSLALQNHRSPPSVGGEKSLAPIVYMPDYICSAILFGAMYTVKLQHMILYSPYEIRDGVEVVRSILNRVLEMLRDASEPSEGLSQPASNPLAKRSADTLAVLIKFWDSRVQERFPRTMASREPGLSGRGGDSPSQSAPVIQPSPAIPTNGYHSIDARTSGPPSDSQPSWHDSSRADMATYRENVEHINAPAPALASTSSLPISPNLSDVPTASTHSAPTQPIAPTDSFNYASSDFQPNDTFGIPQNFDVSLLFDPAFLLDALDSTNFSNFTWPG